MPSSGDRENITSDAPCRKIPPFVVPYHIQKQYKNITYQGEEILVAQRDNEQMNYSVDPGTSYLV
jgi:hypothetical protein